MSSPPASAASPPDPKLPRFGGKYNSAACDFCKKRHNKCDGKKPRCSLCDRYDVPCTFADPQKKRGRKRQFDEAKHEAEAAAVLEQSLREVKCCSKSQKQEGTSDSGQLAQGCASEESCCTRDDKASTGLSAMASYLMRLQIGRPSRMVIEKFFECDLPAVFRAQPATELPETQPRMWSVKSGAVGSPSASAAASPPASDPPLPACCEISRQLVGYTVLAHAALHAREPSLSHQYLDRAEKFFTAKNLLGLPVLNVSKGMLLMAMAHFSFGEIAKASSYCTLVLHHCKLMHKSLHALAQRQSLSTNVMVNQLAALQLSATALLIAAEDDSGEIASVLDSVRSLVESGTHTLDALQLYVQALRVEVCWLLMQPTRAVIRAQQLLAMLDTLLPLLDRKSFSCIARTSMDALVASFRAVIALRCDTPAVAVIQCTAGVAAVAQGRQACGVCSLNQGLAMAVVARVLQELAAGGADVRTLQQQAVELLSDASLVHLGLRCVLERVAPQLLQPYPPPAPAEPHSELPRVQQFLEMRLFSPAEPLSAVDKPLDAADALLLNSPPPPPATPNGTAAGGGLTPLPPLPLDFNEFFSDFFTDF